MLPGPAARAIALPRVAKVEHEVVVGAVEDAPPSAWMSQLAAYGLYAQISGELVPSAGLVHKS